MISVSTNSRKRILTVDWGEGENGSFHYVWLRHSGRCSAGMPNDTSIKIDLLPNDPASLVVNSHVIEDGMLRLYWQDNDLQTLHSLETLRRSRYDDRSRQARKHQPILWDSDSAIDIPRFEYAALTSESEHLRLLLAVRDFGVAKVCGIPVIPGTIRELARLFGPILVNNYGEVFDVRSDANKSLGSNTGVLLPPHTDESYRHDAPGISFFHCLQAGAIGGDSVLVDGFQAAALLRKSDPESFKVLTTVPIFFQRYALPDEDMRSHCRILVPDVDGDIVGLRWTDRTLPPQDLPEALVEPVYKAIRALWTIINEPQQQHCYRLNPGDLHVFDNHRILHGRSEFDPESGPRHLQQCSVNRDEFHNNLRKLAASMGSPASELVMAGGAVG